MLLAASAVVLAACASDLHAVPGGFRHGGHGYRIGEPPSDPARAWRPAQIDGTSLAYRRAGPQVMSLQSHCNRPVARASIMARELLIGLEPGVVQRARPFSHEGADGWMQWFETRLEDRTVRVKTVTLVSDGCSYDWVLTLTGAGDTAERDFDSWWQSFRLDSYTPQTPAS
jgi:hypothetical protein